MSAITDTGLTLEVIGKRPANQPYLRITDANGDYIGSLDEAEMRALRDAITSSRPTPHEEGAP